VRRSRAHRIVDPNTTSSTRRRVLVEVAYPSRLMSASMRCNSARGARASLSSSLFDRARMSRSASRCASGQCAKNTRPALREQGQAKSSGAALDGERGILVRRFTYPHLRSRTAWRWTRAIRCHGIAHRCAAWRLLHRPADAARAAGDKSGLALEIIHSNPRQDDRPRRARCIRNPFRSGSRLNSLSS